MKDQTTITARIPNDLRAELPWFLWLWQMGILLFWIHDQSSGRRRTSHLIERAVVLVTKLISVLSLGVMRPVRRSVLRLVRELGEAA